LEIIIRELSTETNFNAAEIRSESELRTFAINAQFPTHGLILRKHKDDYTESFKGVTNWYQLNEAFQHYSKANNAVYIETDMRAMYNPSRMKVIEKAVQKLAAKINSLCPQCQTPGFGITEAKKGLPCESCSFPTNSTLSHLYSCQKCNFVQEEKYPKGKMNEEAMYCNICNP